MKKKQKQLFREKNVAELMKLVNDKKTEIARLTIKGREEKNTNKIRQLQNEIAVLLTYIRLKKLDEPLVSLAKGTVVTGSKKQKVPTKERKSKKEKTIKE